VAKTPLGRGLGELLGSQRLPKDAPAAESPAPRVDVGLRILIDGATEARAGEVEQPQPAERPVRSRSLAQPAAALVLGLADVALVGWALFHTFACAQFGWINGAIVAGTILLAATCGCVAVFLLGDPKEG
jgi:hypothetical protein